MSVLRLAGVNKAFPTGSWRKRELRQVLRDVALELRSGEVALLRGENGAGKTTLLKTIANLVTPDSGTIEVQGTTASRSRGQIGLHSGEDRSLFLRLSARDNLQYFGALHGLSPVLAEERMTSLVESLDLADSLDHPVNRLSSGVRARIGLVRALLHDPALLLLDEPTRSLDPRHAAAVELLLQRRAEAGVTVLWATHRERLMEQYPTRSLRLSGGTLHETGAS